MANIDNTCDRSYWQRHGTRDNTHPLLVGGQTHTTTMEINMAVFRKLGIDLPLDSAITFSGLYPNDTPFYLKDICSTIFIMA